MIAVEQLPKEREKGARAFAFLNANPGPFDQFNNPNLRLPSSRDQPPYPGEKDRVFVGHIHADVETAAEYASVLAYNAVRLARVKIEVLDGKLYCGEGPNTSVTLYTDTYNKGQIVKSSVGPLVEGDSFAKQSLEVHPVTLRNRFLERLLGFGCEAEIKGDILSAAIALDTIQAITDVAVVGRTDAMNRIGSRPIIRRRVLFCDESMIGPPTETNALYGQFMSSPHGFADLYSRLK